MCISGTYLSYQKTTHNSIKTLKSEEKYNKKRTVKMITAGYNKGKHIAAVKIIKNI